MQEGTMPGSCCMMECAVSLCITEGQVPSSAREKGEKQVNERERFEKFTERARKVLSLAQEEAQRLQHQYIGTEHLLLGLVREGEGIAAGVLESLGVNLEKVRTQTIQVLSQPRSPYERDARHAKTPMIDQMSIDLTAAARAGTLDPVIGRYQEIERVIQILFRRTKNHPALIGEAG